MAKMGSSPAEDDGYFLLVCKQVMRAMVVAHKKEATATIIQEEAGSSLLEEDGEHFGDVVKG